MRRNEEVAALLEEYADLLAARDVEYKPRAYRQAAESVRGSPEAIEDLAAEGSEAVERVDGVGEAIADKIVEYVDTGEVEEIEELRAEFPVDMAALTSVEGVGPKTVGDLYEALGVETLDDLEAAGEAGEIREVKGYGEKTERNILDGIPFARRAHGRELLGDARPIADETLALFDGVDAAERAEVAGSIRRWRDTIGDVDVLVASADGEAVVEAFVEWEAADSVIEAGTSKASVRAEGVRIDLRVVADESFGSALQHFTGSWDHNRHLRSLAIDRDLKINEYGVFDVSGVEEPDAGQRVGERIGGATEAEVYGALDMPPIPPELREDTGELEAALADDLPDLIEEGVIRGDLHAHSNWSDGDYAIEEMAAAAADRGYDYHCVSDHATGPGMVGGVGLTDDELREQMAAVEAARDDADVELFHGVEANVDAEGDVSVGDDVLADLDVVIASPHSALDQGPEAATDRLVRAVEHPDVDVLGHPTGRMLNRRPGLDPDFERIGEAAAAHGVALEINASPHRLDINDGRIRRALDAGASLAIDTDAHSPGELANVRYGVHTARRGWAETGDVLNARDADGVREFLR